MKKSFWIDFVTGFEIFFFFSSESSSDKDANNFFCSSSGSTDIREKHKFQYQLDVFFLTKRHRWRGLRNGLLVVVVVVVPVVLVLVLVLGKLFWIPRKTWTWKDNSFYKLSMFWNVLRSLSYWRLRDPEWFLFRQLRFLWD